MSVAITNRRMLEIEWIFPLFVFSKRLMINLYDSLFRRYMNPFFLALKKRVGPRLYRIFKLYAVHGWRKCDIARRVGLHRDTVGRHISKVNRVARSIAASLGIDDPHDLLII